MLTHDAQLIKNETSELQKNIIVKESLAKTGYTQIEKG